MWSIVIVSRGYNSNRVRYVSVSFLFIFGDCVLRKGERQRERQREKDRERKTESAPQCPLVADRIGPDVARV